MLLASLLQTYRISLLKGTTAIRTLSHSTVIDNSVLGDDSKIPKVERYKCTDDFSTRKTTGTNDWYNNHDSHTTESKSTGGTSEGDEKVANDVTELFSLKLGFGPLIFANSCSYNGNFTFLPRAKMDTCFKNKSHVSNHKTGQTKRTPQEAFNDYYNRVLEILKKTDERLYNAALYCERNHANLTKMYWTVIGLGLFPLLAFGPYTSFCGCFDTPISAMFGYALSSTLLYGCIHGTILLTAHSRYALFLVLLIGTGVIYAFVKDSKRPISYNDY